MQIYALFDDVGNPTGFWNDVIYPPGEAGRHPAIPAQAIEISPEHHAAFCEFPGRFRWQGGSRVEVIPEIPPLTEADYGAAIQAHVESTVKSRSYNDAATCASYVGSTIPAWQADAAAFCAWRDAVWTYAYAQLAAVQDGQRTQPSIADLIGELPAIAWP
jgi:hypothetical protein